MLPNRIIHADWSKQPGKRWLAWATRQPNGRFLVDDLRPVGLLTSFWPRLRAGLPQAALTVAGFDFPSRLRGKKNVTESNYSCRLE
jgi:hypothetical protein